MKLANSNGGIKNKEVDLNNNLSKNWILKLEVYTKQFHVPNIDFEISNQRKHSLALSHDVVFLYRLSFCDILIKPASVVLKHAKLSLLRSKHHLN